MLTQRASGTNYDFSEKSPRKEKKWSFGNLFRRKKKPECGDSSSDENNDSKKKKCNKRKRSIVGFDHVVVPPPSSHSGTFLNGFKNHNESFLSEPNTFTNFIPASSFTTRYVPLKDSQENLDRTGSNKSLGSPQIGSLGRKKKEIIKARAKARRDTSRGEGSSDEDSQKSAFKSDESLSKYKDGSLSKKSRAARTQRYLKRRSRDEEIQDQLRFCKSDIEHSYGQHLKLPNSKSNSSPSSRSSFSGLSTVPPSHNRYKSANVTNGYTPPQYSYSHDHNDSRNKYSSVESSHQRSSSYGGNIHNGTTENGNNIPLGKYFLKSSSTMKQPPAPPPRDPKRILGVQNCDDRPNSYSFENGCHSNNGSEQNISEINKVGLNSNYRSTSEDHISLEQNQRIPLVPRPSSAIPNTNSKQKLSKNHHQKSEEPLTNGYSYFADKNPRSRRPISIQQNNESQKPFDFWRQKDEEFARSNHKNSNSSSPLMFTAQTHVRTTTFLPNGVTVQTDSSIVNPADDLNRVISPFRPITTPPIKSPSPVNMDQKEEVMNNFINGEGKPSNFEDALDELEAIYNSLHLGDEDLLERAEQREAEAAQKRRDALFESFPLSDSSFSFNLNPSRRKLYTKKLECDRRADDMAFRKLNKERCNTISDPQGVTSRISYLLTSPAFNKPVGDYNSLGRQKRKGKEPDVELDDVVYRNVKHTNDTLKVADPQPPFGIPVGPISPASNSDYLHATPEVTRRSMFKPKKIPDVVKDDLAYRNLRKDPTKEPALPQLNLSPEEYRRNYNNKSGIILKKRRPVRSLSANISNLLKNEDIGEVADALEASRRVLKEKEDEISEIRKAFMSDGELTYQKFEENLPLEDEDDEIKKQLQQLTINELLSSLDVETNEANECIANELKMYDEEKKFKKAIAESFSLDSIEQSKDVKMEMLKELEKDASLSLQLPKVDSTLEHTKLCEKLLECVVESTELLATAKVEADDSEEVEPLFHETVANIVLTPKDQLKIIEPVSTEIFSDSDHDYVNIQLSDESETARNVTERCSSIEIDNEVEELLRSVVSEEISASPLEKHKAELLAAFEELRFPEEEITEKGEDFKKSVESNEQAHKGGGI
ncbi:hypothetical protein ILUMI_13653 [Ignelater luminosus]|uniref:Uncharacterized protein n=1 Tax=Ignelater luminosus TaxID=2038154 RepID=A0A8K0CU11_IGNLU|nr:hypothetical protein ILUMI_13653 [Ignelater luminosus]